MTKENKQAILGDSGLIEIRFSYNPNIITQIKQIPGRKWTPKSKTWTVPISQKAINQLTEFGFDIDEKIIKRLENNLLPQPNWDLLPGGLYDFQKEGVKFIEEHGGRALIADEMGLGKTVQSLGWMAIHPEIRPSVVLCPATIKFKWEKEIYTWIGEANTQICSGRVPEIDKNADVFIINYDILPDWIELLEQQNPQFLVIDETQYVKGRSTKRTKATRYFAKSIPFIVGLTGTPIVNRPLEFFTILNILDPVNWFSFWNYVQEYCGATKKTIWNNKIKKKISAWDFTGATNTKRLHTIVSSSLMLRRLKKDVLKQLPPKTRVVIPLEIKNSDSYKQAWKEYQQWLKEGTKGTQLEHRNQLEKLKQLAVKGKMDQALEWIHDFLEENNKLVVFAWHIEIIKLLQDKLKEYNPATIFGETPTNQRAEIANKFQTSPECRVFIGNIKSAGTGIDLFAASAVVFLELVWTPGDHEQAEDRCLTKNNLILQKDENGLIELVSIKDIKIGNYVLGKSGNWKKVTDKWKRKNGTYKNKPITKIEYVGWPEPIECTFDHKFLVKQKNNKHIWKEAYKILPTESLLMPIPKLAEKELKEVTIKEKWRLYAKKPNICSVDNCCTPIYSRLMCREHYRRYINSTLIDKRTVPIVYTNSRYVRLPKKITVSNDLLFVFGWYLAEGFASSRKETGNFLSLSGHKKEWAILERCANVFKSMGVKSTICNCKNTQGIELRAYSGELALWFTDWFGHNAQTKKIPNELMSLPIEQIKILIDAYICGDGYKRKNQVEWTSVSKTLSYQICILSAKCGYVPTFRKVIHPKYKSEHWIGSYSTTKKINNNKWIEHKVRSVKTEYDKTKTVYDITVDDDESFLTGFSLAHNCHRIGQTDNVTAYYLVAKDTVEEDIAIVLDEKQKILTQVLDGKEVKEESLLQELIKKSYSPKQQNIKQTTLQKEIKSVTKKIEVDDLDDFNTPPQRPQQEQHIYKPTETAVTEKICMGLFILFVCLVIGSCAA